MRRLAALALWLRAGGGPVGRDQLYMVGEDGPEAFRPWTNGSGNVWSDTTLDIEQYRLGL